MLKTAKPLALPTALLDDLTGNKTAVAYGILRQAILDAELAPGTPLRQGALQEAYGIGWTPLREALSRLEAERLVTLHRNRGFAVAPVSMGELEDLTGARRVLELAMLSGSIARGDAPWEEALVVAHYRLKTSALRFGEWSKAAISQWQDRHQAFHRALLARCDSPWLVHLYGQVMDQERRHHRVLMFEQLQREAQTKNKPGPPSPAMAVLLDAMDIEHHTDLMEAALARDIVRASKLTVKHVSYTTDVFSQSHPMAQVLKA